MSIAVKDVLTLSDENRYCVVSKTEYQGVTYYYLIDLNNMENIKFCSQDQNELTEIIDEEELKKLFPLFLSSSKDIIKEILDSNN